MAGLSQSTRKQIVRVHRWLGLAAAIFWLIQALTGVLIVFHWEADDAMLGMRHAPTDLVAIERRLDQLTPPGSGRHVTSFWTTAGLADRYNVGVADAQGGEQAIRIAGDGAILQQKPDSDLGFWDTLVVLHQTLLAGTTGSWIVGISGMLLLSNLLLGLIVAWPRRGWWRQSLTPRNIGPKAARLYSWHKAIGLWAVLPALALVSAGTILVFEDGASELIGATSASLVARPAPAGARDIGFAAAVGRAENALPGSRLTAVKMPSVEDAVYRIRLLAPDEIRRGYGTSVVYVDALTGTVAGVFPASAAPWPRTIMDGLYAVHTGELGGLVGRLLVMAIGLWLASMTVMGVLLWAKRRPGTVKKGA